MRIQRITLASGPVAAVCALLLVSAALAQAEPIKLDVDARDVARRILHARLTIPCGPGELTLFYPKWIPGMHGPTGPIADLTGLKITAGAQSLRWQRDAEDMYAFHVVVPDGAQSVEVSLDYLMPSGEERAFGSVSSTPHLIIMNWDDVVLYPKGRNVRDLLYTASLQLPAGWKFGTALPVARESAGTLEFAPVSLETLMDSPVLAGNFFKTVDLTPEAEPAHFLHLAADSAAALEINTQDVARVQHLIAETGALFGSRHYRNYHFLVALSEHISHYALEHHESSDNRFGERALIDEDKRTLDAGTLPHEFVHSWNGKYRRPADLATPDYQQPMKTELLWVYEGLTEYLGQLLTARSGFWTNENYREDLALAAGRLDYRVGRTWRPLVDTAVAAPLNFFTRSGGTAWRRSEDYYPEGQLIWQEADVLIRQKTDGHRSLDDFCKKFFGGSSGSPTVVPYTLDDIVEALNQIATNDWRGFFNARVNAINPRVPLGGIEGSGWRLVYTDKPPDMLKLMEGEHKYTDMRYSLGLTIGEGGSISDVIPGSAADKAGAAPGMKIVAVNGRKWSAELLHAAVKDSKTNTDPIELLVEDNDFFSTLKLDYHDGERYPHLERDPTQPDLLEQMLKPLTPPPVATRSSGN